MGVTRQYLKWVRHSTIGNVYSSGLDCIIVGSELALLATCEIVHLWNLRSKSIVRSYSTESYSRVTKFCKGGNELAVGYSDGNINLFSYESTSCLTVLCGHKSDLTALVFNATNTLLASGGKDTVVIVWDVVNQAGLFRLLGHTGIITDAEFLDQQNFLVTSSKDCLIKFWDLNIQHCTQTVVGHKTEVTSIVFLKDSAILVAGSQDAELRFFSVTYMPQNSENLTDKSHNNAVTVEKIGSILRTQTNSVLLLKRKPESKSCFYCLSQNSKMIERFDLRSDEELKLLKKKKLKKLKNSTEGEIPLDELEKPLEFSDHVKIHPGIQFSHTVKSFNAYYDSKAVFICAGLYNNNIECKKDEDSFDEVIHSLWLSGHRSEVRTVCIANDSSLIISCSKESTKVWSKSKSSCIRTLLSGYALCSVVAPGNRHVIMGSKTGKLYVIDLGNSTVSNIIDAHLGEVWTLDQYPNMKGVVSGGSDKSLKFWDYVLEPEDDRLVLNLALKKKLDMEEDVLAVKVSEDEKYIAAALLDNSVKVFFFDSLKFFLNLYGHKLPVVSIDISSDCQILVSGSADRNMKIWGLDFGDCHRSLFAHEDSVTCVRFLPKTHLIFSCGKDGLIKQWDADKFILIQTLRAHYKSSVWCIAVSPSGDFIVSSGADKSLRVWERTMEPLVIEEERENERELEFNKEIDDKLDRDEPYVSKDTETTLASRKTVETLKGAELLMERLEICEQQAAGEPVPILQALGTTSSKYFLESLSKISSSEMEQSLMMLPFSYASRLIEICCREFISEGLKIEVTCRIVLSLIRMHHARIVSNDELSSLVFSCKTLLQSKIKLFKDRIAFNTFALQYLKSQIEAKEQTRLFADATETFKEKSSRRRRRDKAKAVITVVS